MQVTRATRGLPKDHVGAVRVVTFEGIESNMCCGTHVTNLSQLQAVKLLNLEKGKGSKVLLHFVVGNRVLQRLAESFERENELNLLLKYATKLLHFNIFVSTQFLHCSCGPHTHISMVKKMKDNVKSAQKSILKLLKELAAAEACRVNESKAKFNFVHRADGQESEFIALFLKQITDKQMLIFVTTGDESAKGKFVLQGNDADCAALGPQLSAILDGKGNGAKGRYQAKVNNLKKIADCEAIIKKHFE